MRLAATLKTLTVVFAVAALGAAQQDTAPTSQQQDNQPPVVAPVVPPSTKPPCPANASPGQTLPPDCKSASSKSKHKKHKPPKTVQSATSAPTNSDQGPTKTVVRNGGTTDPSMVISPGLSPQQASHTSNATAKMLNAAKANVKTVSNRQLTSAQEDTVRQVNVLIAQAEKAQSDDDLQRAFNLANKAKMLSDELVAH